MRDGAAPPRASGWTISVAVHTAIIVTLMTVLGPAHRHEASEPLARLVYVEPVPPPLGAPAARAPSETTTAPAVAAPAAATDRLEERKVAAVQPPLRTHVRRITPPPPAPPAAPAAGAPETLAPSTGGSAVGTTSGTAGGTVGGLGSAPLQLRDVAAPPELVARVLPEYPRRARALQVEGQVVLEVVLDRGGRVEDEIRVTRSIPLLDEAAVAAVKQWRFRPARDAEGRPVRVVMEIPVRFVLR
jgi:protein TonB